MKFGSGCEKRCAMQKADLVLTSKPEDDFLSAHCSSCPQVRFKLSGNTLEYKRALRTMFDAHFRRVHMRDKPADTIVRDVIDSEE
jgi:hypothetical protein